MSGLISGLIFGLTACGSVQDEPTPPALDEKTLEKAEELYCKPGQKLIEDRPSLNVTFDKLADTSNIFAFSNNNGECALEQDIDQNWPSEKDPMSFKMKINRKCLPNHSIWIAEEMPTERKPLPPKPDPLDPNPPKPDPPKKEKTYFLRKVASPGWPAIEMTGSNNLAGNYVGGLTGLRILICQ